MQKEFLITEQMKLNYKKKIKFIFFDEYIQSFYDREKLDKLDFSTFYSFKDLAKINYNSKILHKKIRIYRSELTKTLNMIHRTRFGEKYWGLIIDQLTYIIVNSIIIELSLLKNIFKSNKDILLFKVNFKNFYLDTIDFLNSHAFDNRQAFTRYIIAKKIGFKIENFKVEKSVQGHNRNKFSERLHIKILRLIFRNYVKLYKPKLILDSYLGKINDLKIFFKSFGKICSIPSNFFFNYRYNNIKKDIKKRNKIKVSEIDLIDEIFNVLIKEFIPASYVENFQKYHLESKKFSFLKMIGTAVSSVSDDHFKYLSAEVLKNQGKLIVLQHGALTKKVKYNFEAFSNEKYASKCFYWKDKEIFHENYFSKFNKYNLLNNEKYEEILIYPTTHQLKTYYKFPPLKKYHLKLNLNYKFYENLNNNLKNKVKIKLFPDITSNLFISNWKKKYNKNHFIDNKKNLFNFFKITIIDDVSTALCELLYVEAPFILIDDEFLTLKSETYKKIIKLKKLNVLFQDPTEAAHFLNKNYDNIEKWWDSVKKKKIFKEVKKYMIPDFSKKIKFKDKIKI